MHNRFKILLSLIRFRLSAMVTFSALVGYLIYGEMYLYQCVLLVIGVFLLSGGTSALNQVQEQKRDRLMRRTADRPLVTGLIKSTKALVLSFILMLTGTFVLLLTEWQTALLGIINILLYNLIYTNLKSKTALAIVPGGMVGAVPPVMGWTAAGGDIFHPTILFVAIFMFLWQLPHFWLLLMVYGKDYEKAGFKGLPKLLSQARIKLIIFSWTMLTSAFLFLFPLFDIRMLPLQTGILAAINIAFIMLFFQLLMNPAGTVSPKRAFVALNSYVMLILVFFIWVAG